MASLLVFLFTLSYFAASDAASETHESGTTDTTEMRLTVDVTDRYTGGEHIDDANASSAGKIMFIGIVCLLLLAGIIIIAVKSRDDDIGEEVKEACASPENGGDKESD